MGLAKLQKDLKTAQLRQFGIMITNTTSFVLENAYVQGVVDETELMLTMIDEIGQIIETHWGINSREFISYVDKVGVESAIAKVL